MHALPNVRLHQRVSASLPNTGQRRDILMKAIRKIQVSPEAGGDFHWNLTNTGSPVEVTVCVGYAISWVYTDGTIRILDIRQVPA